jgi:SAM-dependent methyltransferase
MATATKALISQYYPSARHPYRILESQAMKYVLRESILVDAGCGHSAPLLLKLAPHVSRAIGVDIGNAHPPGIEYIQADLANTGLPGESVDLIVSRSVFEHLRAPLDSFLEFHRVLRPGGRVVFLTPNRWDYASLVSLAVPNRLHPLLVRRLTDRQECDTFPTFYRANTRRAIHRLARRAGFDVESLQYLNQYPDYFRKILPLFLLGIGYERLTSSWDGLKYLRGWILGTLVRGSSENFCHKHPN